MANDKLMDDIFDALGAEFVNDQLLEEDELWPDYYRQTVEPVYMTFNRFTALASITHFIRQHGRNGLDILNQALIEASCALKRVQELEEKAVEVSAHLKQAKLNCDALRIKYGICWPRIPDKRKGPATPEMVKPSKQ